MDMETDRQVDWPATAVVFGASGGIGRALCDALAARGCRRIYAGTRRTVPFDGDALAPFRFDLEDEASIRSAADSMAADPPELVIVASGVLTLADGTGPERSFRKLDPAAMDQVLRINAIGPALVAKHMLPLLPRDKRGVFAAISARVGSISDNRLGGWHSYRASKAALNMLLRNFAIEMGRTHKHTIVAGLHPGTVDTGLSEPFQGNLPEGQLMEPPEAAGKLIDVINRLGPADSGSVFDFNGERVPT